MGGRARQTDRLPHWVVQVGRASWYFIGACASVALLGMLLAATRDITVPLILGLFFAVALQRPMQWLVSRQLPAGIAAALIVVGAIALIGGVIAIIVAGLATQGSEITDRLVEASDDIGGRLERVEVGAGVVDQARESVDRSAGTLGAGLASDLVGVINSAVGVISGTVLGLVVLYYFLKDGPALLDSFIDGQPESRRATLRRIAGDSAQQIEAYARGRTVMAVMNGVALGVAAAVIGVPMPFAIGIVNFVGAYIPYFGAFVGGAFAFLLALSGGGLTSALVIVGAALFVNLGLENSLEPWILGDELEMHPLLVLVATVLGGLAMGIIGLILAAPLTAIGLNLHRELRASGFFDD